MSGGVSPVGQGGAVAPSEATRGARGGASAQSLLPAPALAMLGDISSALDACAALQAKSQVTDTIVAGAKVADEKAKVRKAQEDYRKAIDEQREAERKANSFWGKLKKVAGKVAKVAALVAAGAAAIGTGGAGLPGALAVAGVVLSTGGMAVSTLKVFGRDSDKIGMWMEIAGAGVGAAGCVAGLMATSQAAKAAQVGDAASKTAQGSATKVAEVGAKSASSFERAMKITQLGGHLTAMVAGMTSATAGIVVAHHQFDADMAAVEKERAQNEEQKGSQELKAVIEALQRSDELSRELIDATSKAIEGCSKASEAAMTGVLKA